MAEKKMTVIPATKARVSAQYSTFTKKRRVAAYARVSTDKEEQENSFEAQVKYYSEYIGNNPEWEFVKVYSDEGISGTYLKLRTGFNEMIADALAGKIDLILTKSVSRFARNTVDSLTTVRKLKDKGVEVYFEKENIYTLDSKGELLITIMSSLAQEESRSISENVVWGKRRAFENGKFSLAYSHFLGYDKGENGEMVVNPEQAEVVKRIYSEYLYGYSPNIIAKRLTADGIPTPAGKENWRADGVISILTNEKYYGAARLQKTVVYDWLTHSKKENEGEAPMYYIENDHEAIVSPATYQMVQEEMQRRRDAGGKAQCVSPFSGRIVCSDCGCFYGRKKWHSGSKYETWEWHCNNKFQGREKCETPTLKEESLTSSFVAAFNSVLKRKTEIKENYRLCLDAITDTSEYETQMEKINEGATEVNSLIETLLYKGGRNNNGESVVSKLEEYQGRLDQFARAKQELDMKIAACRSKRILVESFLEELEKHDTALPEFDQMVWQSCVNHAKVNKDCTITFVFRDGTEETTPITNAVRPYHKKAKV